MSRREAEVGALGLTMTVGLGLLAYAGQAIRVVHAAATGRQRWAVEELAVPVGSDPEVYLSELRAARRTVLAEAAPAVDRTAQRMARDLWPETWEREAAGVGMVMAAATLGHLARPGGEATMLNLVGLLGQSLVDDARAERDTT